MVLSGHKNIFNTKIGIQYLFMVPRFYGDDAWIPDCETVSQYKKLSVNILRWLRCHEVTEVDKKLSR